MLSERARGTWRRVASAARADDGIALATVMSIAAIIFILATTLIMIATQQAVSAGGQVQRNKALASADAGINDYLYNLSDDPDYWRSTPDRVGQSVDASWTLHAERPGGVGPVVLTATGVTPQRGNIPSTRRVVKASVQSPTFADYMFMLNTSCSFGSGALVKGNVRSNGSIANNGTITGNAYAHTTYSGGGTCQGSVYQNYPTLSFAAVDFGKLQSIASTDNTDFSSLPEYEPIAGGLYRAFWGYDVKFTGAGGTITPIRTVDANTGARSLFTTGTGDYAVRNFLIPTEGVLYFDYPIWVSGTYSAKVTVVTFSAVHQSTSDQSNVGSSGLNDAKTSAATVTNKANSAMYLWDNLVPADPQSDQVCGVVARGDISVPSNYDVMPSTLYLTCALLSTAGSVHADMASGQTKTKMHFEGAFASYLDGGFTSTNMGFNTRDYWYDTRLNATPPPNFPPLGDGTLRVQSWVEQ
jgi:hypothetical protein